MRKYIILIVLLSAVELCLSVYLTYWREAFWNYVQQKDFNGFVEEISIFTGVAIGLCLISATTAYMSSLAAIKWREKLNEGSYILDLSSVENGNQRIQDDLLNYPQLMLSIGFSFAKAVIYVIVFSITLLFNFSYIYLLIIFTYAILSTFVANKIAKPLISLNYQFQRVEATYRNYINKLNFKECIVTMLALAKKTKHLQYFQILYGQLSVVIPLIIIAPVYFMGKMTLGSLMQANSIMGTIIENMSIGINSFDSVNKLISCRKRLKEINII